MNLNKIRHEMCRMLNFVFAKDCPVSRILFSYAFSCITLTLPHLGLEPQTGVVEQPNLDSRSEVQQNLTDPEERAQTEEGSIQDTQASTENHRLAGEESDHAFESETGICERQLSQSIRVDCDVNASEEIRMTS